MADEKKKVVEAADAEASLPVRRVGPMEFFQQVRREGYDTADVDTIASVSNRGNARIRQHSSPGVTRSPRLAPETCAASALRLDRPRLGGV